MAVAAAAADGVTGAPADALPSSGAGRGFFFSFETADEDHDFDGQPDDWSRRKGTGFPAWIRMHIAAGIAADGAESLRVEANGGPAILYSPPLAIDPLHDYAFEGAIRTVGLHNDAALFSLSFLDEKRRRVQRFLTPAVSGTHAEWQRLRLASVEPDQSVRFVVIGCHLVERSVGDIGGEAWFDAVRLTRLPRLRYAGGLERRYVPASRPVEIAIEVSGLAALATGPDEISVAHRLEMELLGRDGAVVETHEFPLDTAAATVEAGEAGLRPQTIVWKLPPHAPDYYRTRARLVQNDSVMLEEESSLVIMEPTDASETGAFGWTVGDTPHEVSHDEMASIALEAGVHWLKYPLWRTVGDGSSNRSDAIIEMFERLSARNVTPVGVLIEPPLPLRRKFADDWKGVAEVLSLPPAVWSSSIDAVAARYASVVQHWQLGGDADVSFTTLNEPEPV
ncbi:MAG: hypothetical protein KY476_24360, partial [Planctomycetes bacterium]|nr:hypothetical protein [Planctomycetota bacterium]